MLPDLEGRTRVLVGHDPGDSESAVRSLLHVGASLVTRFHLVPLLVADVPHEALLFLHRQPGIRRVEPDLPVRVLGRSGLWSHRRTHAYRLHRLGLTGRGVSVAVLDTGIADTHPNLVVAGGVNLVDGTSWRDRHGHGTAVASIIGDRTELSPHSTIGTAPGCSLYAVKILGDRGVGSTASLIAGIEWSVDNGMHIIHMSLAVAGRSRSLRMACAAACRAGALLVAAAGNNGGRSGRRASVEAPACFRSVLGVGAVGRLNRRAPFSATGPGLDLVAPGVDIPCAVFGGFEQQTGTSSAAAQVTGVAALLLEAFSLPPRRLRYLLPAAARPAGPPHLYGAGRLDARRAWEHLAQRVLRGQDPPKTR